MKPTLFPSCARPTIELATDPPETVSFILRVDNSFLNSASSTSFIVLFVKLGRKKIEKLIQKIGIFRIKAKSIFNLSKILIEKHKGKVPKTYDELEKLPGVGHKTASVVMSQGFGFPAFPVDTHIHRLAQRWGLTDGKSVVKTEKDLKSIFPKKHWNKLHLQIIWYGREFCKARDCYGISCKICKRCYPNRRKPIKTRKA